MPYVLLFILLLLNACAAQMHPLKPQLSSHLRTIDLAKIEMTPTIHIRRLNFATALLGSSGMLVDSITLVQNSSYYQSKAGDVASACFTLFEQQLLQNLKDHGYQVRYSNKRYWDYFKPSQKALRQSSDGILRIRFEQQGFYAAGFASDYKPSVIVVAELVHPITRKILYRDQFATGFQEHDIKNLSLYFGAIRSVKNGPNASSYHNLNELIQNHTKSRQDLLDTISLSSHYISQGLKPPVLSSIIQAPKLILDTSLQHD